MFYLCYLYLITHTGAQQQVLVGHLTVTQWMPLVDCGE